MRDRKKTNDLIAFIQREVDRSIDAKMERFESMVDYCVHKKLQEVKGRVGQEIRARAHIVSSSPRQQATDKNQHGDARDPSPMVCTFGHEDYSYLMMPKIGHIIKTSPDFFVALQKVIAELFFNTEKAFNHNLYIPPNSYKIMTVFLEDSWKNLDLEFAIESIIRRANDVLQHHYVNNTHTVMNAEFKNVIGKKKWEGLKYFTDMIDNIEEYPDFRTRLFKETEHTIVTNQHLAHPWIFEPGLKAMDADVMHEEEKNK